MATPPDRDRIHWVRRVFLELREAKDLDEWAKTVNQCIDRQVYAWVDRDWMKEAVIQFARIGMGKPPLRSIDDPMPSEMLPEHGVPVTVSRSKYAASEMDAYNKACDTAGRTIYGYKAAHRPDHDLRPDGSRTSLVFRAVKCMDEYRQENHCTSTVCAYPDNCLCREWLMKQLDLS